MAKHCCKVITLLLPSLTTICLLSYCLISDRWIRIDERKLVHLSKLYESDYNEYLSRVNLLNAQKVQVNEQLNDDGDEDQDMGDDYDQTDNENLFNKNGQKNLKSNDQENVKERPNFVYITKLWPFKKYKSLYSDCIEYKEFKLRLSVSYLTAERKEPLIGSIHYYDTNNLNNQTNCNEKSGMIKCLFSQQCRVGKSCDGIVDCEDQSDEQLCDESRTCQFKSGITGFKCDNKCWQYWNKCDQIPHCFNLSDEISNECVNNQLLSNPVSNQITNETSFISAFLIRTNNNLLSYTLGSNHYDPKLNCFRNYFNFKTAKLINKDSLKYLNQQLADNIQEMNNINYHLQLIYNLSFVSSLIFALFALTSLLFISCFKKLCFQCPFWFYGFFQIVSWLTCLFGLMTFLYQFYTNKQKGLDPLVQLPINNEILRLNTGLLEVEKLGISFWLAVGATSCSFLSSFFSCLICCRLPSSRHEDKEYKIMQLPTYS